MESDGDCHLPPLKKRKLVNNMNASTDEEDSTVNHAHILVSSESDEAEPHGHVDDGRRSSSTQYGDQADDSEESHRQLQSSDNSVFGSPLSNGSSTENEEREEAATPRCLSRNESESDVSQGQSSRCDEQENVSDCSSPYQNGGVAADSEESGYGAAAPTHHKSSDEADYSQTTGRKSVHRRDRVESDSSEAAVSDCSSQCQSIGETDSSGQPCSGPCQNEGVPDLEESGYGAQDKSGDESNDSQTAGTQSPGLSTYREEVSYIF